MSNFIVGVDCAKATFTAATVWQGTTVYLGEFANTALAHTQFATAIKQRVQTAAATAIHLIIEPTGGYEAELVAMAYAQGWLVTLVNPLAVRRWAQGQGKRAKTDRQDALMLAHFGAERNPAPQNLPDAAAEELTQLLRRQTDLEQLLRSERNRLDHAQRPTAARVQRSIQRTIDALEQERATVNDDIRQLIAGHADLLRHLKHLLSVPGIGAKTAPHLLALFYRFLARTAGQGTAKQVVAYLGLDPLPHSSGTSVNSPANISRMGDSFMRSRLFLCALGGVRGKNRLREVYQSLVARGKPKKVALVACARKALVWAWAVFTQDTAFDSAHFVTQTQLPA